MAEIGVPCYDCFNTSGSLCEMCEIKANVCLVSGRWEGLDEGISTSVDVVDWIIWNVEYWLESEF
jgi:hypothetical protein